jgi:ribosomal protein L3 glutamine methyltransferase
MATYSSYSINARRNLIYSDFLASFETQRVTVIDLVQLGYKLMRKARLHPHFFDGNSLLATAQYLSCFALQIPYNNTNNELVITSAQAKVAIKLFERRIVERIPVEYITSEAFYLGRKFYVNPYVLIPRSLMDTRFSQFLSQVTWDNYKVLDLCAGSGCIGISLALLNPQISVDLVDLCPQALEVAQYNVNFYNLGARVKCINSDLFANVSDTYDLIITNPPYVSAGDYRQIPAEFKHEPQLALESGRDGLDLIHRIIASAPNYLNPQGKIIAEVGYPAAKRIKKHYATLPFTWFDYHNPKDANSWFNIWLKPLVAMDCIFILEK